MELDNFLGRNVFMEDTVLDALIVGSGAAAYNAAVHLYDRGPVNFAIITENRLWGTSRNTGSDKQTYYKVACAGKEGDSPRNMAETLFDGGSMDGDIALCEAAHSLEEFFHLAALRVDFPHNTYGEFAGYKTDHDPLQRASSIGPYTSKKMTEQLEMEVKRRDIRIIDKTRLIKLLHDEKVPRVYGAFCLVHDEHFAVYLAKNIIVATGGPAGLYRNTVYPLSQFGSSGILAREGINFANITEWQYGIGSVKFRWNLSGSYQQVIPRYIALDDKGEEEFLCSYFSSIGNLGRAVFLKGYEWPFNPAKIAGQGSSMIDYAIYREKRLKGRRIYIDFMHNPLGNDRIGIFNLDTIDASAYTYLANSNALQATPLERLKRLNPLAYELYLSHGIDLAKEYLEVDVLPQHHNGGVEVNIWWETSLAHLFAIGECAGTHGIKRPGGSALNSGQVGGLRAASFIAGHYLKDDAYFAHPRAVFDKARDEIKNFEKEFEHIGQNGGSTPGDILLRVQEINTASASFIRSRESTEKSLEQLKALEQEPLVYGGDLRELFQLKETMLLSRLLHEAILYYISMNGKSRGSCLYLEDKDDGILSKEPATDPDYRDMVLTSALRGSVINKLRPVHPIPESDTWFEEVWRKYRDGEIFTSS
ncbi:MAG: FAD-binding protein [Treponema sp.]|jgi:succinate dehydrogenase/fumarate reductase flavoprotein subunit|nr:FAD-binding protein [Treponema sp.]